MTSSLAFGFADAVQQNAGATPLSKEQYFSDSWRKRKSSKGTVIRIIGGKVNNLSAAKQKKVSSWCEKQVNKPYNYDLYNMKTRAAFYCSHLIWAGYKDKYKINLNTSAYDIDTSQETKRAIAPMEIFSKKNRSLKKTVITYRKGY